MHRDPEDAGKLDQPNAGFERLLQMLPAEAGDFAGSQCGQPAATAYFGSPVQMDRLGAKADQLRCDRPERLCDIAMVMAEVIEANCPDKAEHFITDAKTRGYVFSGAKWTAGWVFIMGSGDHAELATAFKEKGFLVFLQNAGAVQAVDLGPRETAAVYFLQLMVRYAMTWGRIEPGQSHEMSHFLETDMPGLVVGHGRLTPVEELLLLGLMKMGASAVVPPDYPYDLGRQVRAENAEEILAAGLSFPNLRVKEIGGEVIGLPEFCDPAHAQEPFEAEAILAGENSFFVLMPGDVEAGEELPAENDLTGAEEIGIVVRIGDDRLDVPLSKYLQETALKSIDMIAGVRGETTDAGQLRIACAKGVRVLADRLAKAISAGLKHAFPLLEKIHVQVTTDPGEIAQMNAIAGAFVLAREEAIAGESDENTPYFYYCIECQPFSREHVCIVSPDRPPMCGRNPFQVAAAAVFGANWHPYKRREIEDGQLRGRVAPGEPVDADGAGEYEAVNRIVEKLSGGNVTSIRLHSVRRYPHTSCGCFQFLAFWSDALDGIGIMERNYAHSAPGEVTWDQLANAAGGKQTPGVVGISGAYLRSRRLLQGDGGRQAIRWLSPKAYDVLEDSLPDPAKVVVGP